MIKTARTMPDARCSIILLILTNIVAFTQNNIITELSDIFFLFLICLFCKNIKNGLKWIAILTAIIFIQSFVVPSINNSFFAGFSVVFSVFRKLIPCVMVGSIIINSVPMQYIILALRKFHIPQAVLIPLAVTIRYIPSVKTETSQIRDAMKLRSISKLSRAECIMTSLIINAAGTAEELSAAAVTRGIENPCKKTSALEMKFCLYDYIIIVTALIFALVSILL